jgi:hypothetical protein
MVDNDIDGLGSPQYSPVSSISQPPVKWNKYQHQCTWEVVSGEVILTSVFLFYTDLVLVVSILDLTPIVTAHDIALNPIASQTKHTIQVLPLSCSFAQPLFSTHASSDQGGRVAYRSWYRPFQETVGGQYSDWYTRWRRREGRRMARTSDS